MNNALSPQSARNNHLLAALSGEEYERLLPSMEHVRLSFGEVLREPGEASTHVYFPHDAVISLVSAMESGASAELAMVSSEGMIGLHVFLGSDAATNQAVVQVAGDATRVKAQVFRDEFCKSRLLRALLQRYTHVLLTQTSQTAVCNRLHRMEERFARWLLLIHDRLGKDEFKLTQEIICQMLGVRRASVSTAAVKLRRRGLIHYHRGHIRILDRAGLEATACECYEIIKAEFDRLQIAPLMEKVTSVNANSRNTSEHKRTVAERERALETLRDINSRLLIAGIREQEAREEAEEANRAKEEFLATLSHELRTPLTAMLGWSRMLRASKKQDKTTVAKALEVIERNAETQQQLIESMLDVSRITAGKLQLDTRALDLRPVIEEALDTVRPAADAKNVRLHFAPDADAVFVSGDAQRLQQVLSNLLSNSIKFTPEKGSVRITLERVNSLAQIKVSDSGRGIAAGFLPHVFDRFRQANATDSSTHGGLGLGLTIVRHLVELHGGTVEAASGGEGMGATFTVNLPLADQTVEEKIAAGSVLTHQ
jgi:signal transduction histidine kinase/CRP-like cAMP-binding protein